VTQELSQRARLVLASVVANYITTAEPVGSRTVSKQKEVDFSPATVRNVMSDLEEMGYLEQPHVSAGRVPTAEGLRLYVDQPGLEPNQPPGGPGGGAQPGAGSL